MQRPLFPVASRAFQTGFWLALVCWIVAAEIFCRTATQGFWYRHFDFSGRLVSLPEIADRLTYYTQSPFSVCVLGDSVAGASALIEHRVPDAEAGSLTRRLQANFARRGRHLFSLSADGMLIPDIESIATAFDAAPPAGVLILLNYRMFAPELQTAAGVSRAFLERDAGRRQVSDSSASLSAVVEGFAQRHSALFRSTQLLKSLWYFPTQKDFFQRQLERWMPPPRDADLVEAALKLKVASYYRDVAWRTDSAAFRSLGRLLERLDTAHIPARIVLTPQNTDFLGDLLDPEMFRQNRAVLDEFVRAHAGGGTVYVDWAERYPARSFLDHCHLTGEGNDQYARDLVALLVGNSG
jgi:hypothetical protein